MEYSTVIHIDSETRREALDQIPHDFPYSADLCDLHSFPGNTFPWHWHQELEVFFMQEGRLEYHTPGSVTVFEAGQGGFINTNVLHKTTCWDDVPCVQAEQQFSPAFIGGADSSRIMRQFVQPILSAPGLTLVKFDPAVSAHQPLLDALRRCARLFSDKPDGFELEIQSQMLLFWKHLYALTRTQHNAQSVPIDDHRIKQMLAFIAAHYAEPLQLEDIARAAFMSPRACGRCFQTQLGTTPFAYLLDYRIQRASELLVTTTRSIGEIAEACGFCNSSYFGRVFRDKTAMTPNAFRKRQTRP